MGRRREPRKEIQAQVRIFGTDSSGKVFSDKAVTVNVSRNGAELSGVHPTLNLDEIIGLSYGANRVHFRVKWVGEPGTAKEGHVGLLNTSPEKTSLGLSTTGSCTRHSRAASCGPPKVLSFQVPESVELHTQEGLPSGTTSDLSVADVSSK